MDRFLSVKLHVVCVVSVPCSLMVTCWERADLLAVVFIVFCHFPKCVLIHLWFCAHLFIDALWSPAGKGLTSWLSFVMSNCEVVTFPLVSWVRCGA